METAYHYFYIRLSFGKKTSQASSSSHSSFSDEDENIDPQACFEAAEELFNRKRYDMSFDMYEDAAKKNHAEAQYTVGLLCQYGRGTGESSSDAMDWFLKAAGQGNKDACLSVAKLAHSEFGGITNKKIALQWYLKSNTQPILVKTLQDEGVYLSAKDKEKPLQDLVSELQRYLKTRKARREEFSYGCAFDSDSDGDTEEIYASYSSKHEMVSAISDLKDKVESLGEKLNGKDDLIDGFKGQVHAILNPSEPRAKRVKVQESKPTYDSNSDCNDMYASYSSRHDMVYAIDGLQKKVKSLVKKHGKKNELIDLVESRVYALRNPLEPRSKRMILLEDELRGQVDPLPQEAPKKEVEEETKQQQQQEQQAESSTSQSGCKRQRTVEDEK